MAHLSLSLLGTFQAFLDASPVTQFESNKVRALLAYLAIEAEYPHPRASLASLLWPEQPERLARHNLSQALFNLRRVLGDHETPTPFLIITRKTIQFNRHSTCQIDVAKFTTLLSACERHPHHRLTDCPACIERLQQAVSLYRGDFLERFSLDNAAPFDEWCLLQRERLHRQAVRALQQLIHYYERRNAYEQAIQYAWRQVELDPWSEEPHQHLMRLLALSGRRSEALAQYELCRQILAQEMGVEPAVETKRLYEQIRDGTLGPSRTPGHLDRPQPAATVPTSPSISLSPRPGSDPMPFVAREDELAWLETHLQLALAGQGHVVFVTGGAGWGKTALIREFARRAQQTHADLIVAGGGCNAYMGIGDPYLPFRSILSLLTGDLEAAWAIGAITHQQALKLQNMLPHAVQALTQSGPELLDVFISGMSLLNRALAHTPGGAPWIEALRTLLDRKAADSDSEENTRQSDLFEQYTKVLRSLARRSPLLLLLDDLQWADSGSISLLFHLGRRLVDSRILIVGAYRPDEIATQRDREQHPLEPIVREFQSSFGDILIELDRLGNRKFVEAILDTEPNRLGETFRETLYRQTGGHPLFTIELLRDMQERGDLVRDSTSCWVEGPSLDWDTLPARVEAAIAERIGRLSEELQSILAVASVEGEEFTAEVVAHVWGIDEGETIRRLSSELEKRHRLVRALGIRRVGNRRLSRYRFQHYLFQRYLYNRLDEVERVTLHEEVGHTLEALYEDQVEEICVSLARHFEEARIADKAIEYLRQAGERAVRLSAHEEAIAHFTRALDLLETQPDTPERVHQELSLQILLGNALLATKGYTVPEVGERYARARELCRRVGKTPQLFPVLHGLHRFYLARAELQTSRDLAEQCLELAQHQDDSILLVPAHRMMGTSLFFLGEFASALEHFDRGMALYDSERHRSYALLCSQDEGVGCQGYGAWALWELGYPDQAIARSHEALALAQALSHPYSLAYALVLGAWVHHFCRKGPEVQELAEEAISLSAKRGFAFWWTFGTVLRGWALTELGQVEAGIELLYRGLDAAQTMGIGIGRPYTLRMLAEALAKMGRVEDALSLLSEALVTVHESGEASSFVDLYRTKGELLLTLSQEHQAEAETCFQRAIEIARQQRARILELRAATSLSRLWWSQGKGEKARQLLAQVYGWFSEGFDTPDLMEAKALLDAWT